MVTAKENAFSCLAIFLLIELKALTDALRHIIEFV